MQFPEPGDFQIEAMNWDMFTICADPGLADFMEQIWLAGFPNSGKSAGLGRNFPVYGLRMFGERNWLKCTPKSREKSVVK